MTESRAIDLPALKSRLTGRAHAMGFDALGVAPIELTEDEQHLIDWLAEGFHGEMHYMQRHGLMRSRPADLAPGTLRVISVRMNYWPAEAKDSRDVLSGEGVGGRNGLGRGDGTLGYVSRYALGRDYHKVMRNALEKLAREFVEEIGPFGYRVCVDSAPVLEKALARNAGLGWIGKHTNLIARDAGSYFFLGEILTDLPLPLDAPASAHCGTCDACIPACPTSAILAPHKLDARRCIAYLTIESKEAIPVELRPLLGNRIYGCDDCQLVCPWNKFARAASHPDFKVRQGLDAPRLTELFSWTEAEWDERMRGSAIYRIGYERWSRNVAVALGNAAGSAEVVQALTARYEGASEMLREHICWALAKHKGAASREPA
jgi:epoxyqueuosine reductase